MCVSTVTLRKKTERTCMDSDVHVLRLRQKRTWEDWVPIWDIQSRSHSREKEARKQNIECFFILFELETHRASPSALYIWARWQRKHEPLVPDFEGLEPERALIRRAEEGFWCRPTGEIMGRQFHHLNLRQRKHETGISEFWKLGAREKTSKERMTVFEFIQRKSAEAVCSVLWCWGRKTWIGGFQDFEGFEKREREDQERVDWYLMSSSQRKH